MLTSFLVSALVPQLHKKGMYKAMGEFDIFIDYIEEYLMMKIGKWHLPQQGNCYLNRVSL